ncbi:MAG TPA: DUF1801 domain-containing protein [Polyangiaceae bacterium]|nr:DUF1801 domain-containing protein [Polyangiaceae bacterium]
MNGITKKTASAKPTTAASKKAPPKKTTPAKAAPKKIALKKAPPKKTAPKNVASLVATKRADLGAPIDGFFAKQPPHLRSILDALRKMVDEAAPEASSTTKWGMPFFQVDGEMMCAFGAHKSHVNLILPGPPGTYGDPEGRLTGEGKTGRHLKLLRLEELPRNAVRGWLRTAAERARKPK